jgi:D-alanyl-D-alanine dipeptidase
MTDPSRRAASSEALQAQARVPIRDNGEPLVDFVGLAPRLRFAEEHPVYDFERVHLVRRRVAELLAEAAARLPDDLVLYVVEGWRSPAVQRQMYEATEREFRKKHPDWPPAVLRRTVNRFSAPPDHRVPPPHCTGGAVDLEIRTTDGHPLDVTSPFRPAGRQGAATNARGLTPTARCNRDMMVEILTNVGFTNYPAEWWHWEYGTAGWALRTGQPHALYGLIPGCAGVSPA